MDCIDFSGSLGKNLSAIIFLTFQIECVVPFFDGFKRLKHQAALVYLPWATQTSARLLSFWRLRKDY